MSCEPGTPARLQLLWFAQVLAVAALLACAKKVPQGASIACFDATAGKTTPGTRAVFAERHCQGGGVTWAELIRAMLQRRGRVEPVLEPTPGWSGEVSALNGRTHFSIDEEADSARFCTDDAELLAAVQRDYERVNTDQGLLRKAMSEAPSLGMECLEADGGMPGLPDLLAGPVLPQEQAHSVRASVAQLKETIRKQPLWCFPGGGAFDDSTGSLRFIADDRVVYTRVKAAAPRSGTVTWPREESGDDRVQITEPTLLHLDVGDASGRLGRSYYGYDATLIREELIPGDECLR
jgi:hypothetical protein